MLGNFRATYVIYRSKFSYGSVEAAQIFLDNPNPYPNLYVLQGAVKFESKILNGVFT